MNGDNLDTTQDEIVENKDEVPFFLSRDIIVQIACYLILKRSCFFLVLATKLILMRVIPVLFLSLIVSYTYGLTNPSFGFNFNHDALAASRETSFSKTH